MQTPQFAAFVLTLDSSRISLVCICPINVPRKSSNTFFFFFFLSHSTLSTHWEINDFFVSAWGSGNQKRNKYPMSEDYWFCAFKEPSISNMMHFFGFIFSRKKNRIILIILSWQIRFSLFSFLYWLNFYVLVANKLWKQSATWPQI